MSNKTVEDAAKSLPKEVQKPFLRAWKATKCMDIYAGYIEDYMQVIAQHLEENNKKVKTLKEIFNKETKAIAKETKSIASLLKMI